MREVRGGYTGYRSHYAYRMPDLKITNSTLVFSHQARLAPAGCWMLALMALGAAVTGTDGFWSTLMALAGAAFAGWGGLMFVERCTITLDAETKELTVNRYRFRKTEQFTLPLAVITTVRSEHNSHEGQRTWRVCLLTPERIIPLTTAFSTSGGSEAPAIHAWLVRKGYSPGLEECPYDYRQY